MKKNKEVSKSFIGFLCVSILIWILITMSKEYETTIKLPIAYQKIPQHLLLQKEPLKELNFSIKGSGFKIALVKFKNKKLFFDASLPNKKAKSKYYLLTKNYKSTIQKQLPTGVVLQQINKDSLFLNLGSLQSKKFPVISNNKIKYHVGYDLSSPIKIEPDSILVSGPEEQIEELKGVQLQLLALSDVKEDFSHQVSVLKNDRLKNLRFELENVTISGKVEKFTEGSFFVDFEILNQPEDILLNSLTKKVEVTFVVALSNFNKVTYDSFKVECDYKTAVQNNLTYLIPKIVSKPAYIKSVKLIPNKIDFLIQK